MAVGNLPNLSKWGSCTTESGKQGSFFEHSNSSELQPVHLLQLQYMPSPHMPNRSLGPPQVWSGPFAHCGTPHARDITTPNSHLSQESPQLLHNCPKFGRCLIDGYPKHLSYRRTTTNNVTTQTAWMPDISLDKSEEQWTDRFQFSYLASLLRALYPVLCIRRNRKGENAKTRICEDGKTLNVPLKLSALCFIGTRRKGTEKSEEMVGNRGLKNLRRCIC